MDNSGLEPRDVASVYSGGLEVRLATDLVLSAFLSSVHAASTLTLQLLPSRLHEVSGDRDPVYVSRKCALVLPSAQNQVGLARLIADASHSGDFLHAIPCSSVGTRLDDTSLRMHCCVVAC